MPKKMKRKTIGKMSNSRVMWHIKPTTRVVKNRRKENNRQREKEQLRKEIEQW